MRSKLHETAFIVNEPFENISDMKSIPLKRKRDSQTNDSNTRSTTNDHSDQPNTINNVRKLSTATTSLTISQLNQNKNNPLASTSETKSNGSAV